MLGRRKVSARRRSVAAVIVLFCLAPVFFALSSRSSLGDNLDSQPFPRMPPRERPSAPREAMLEDLFPRTELSFQLLQPYSLERTRIPGLADATVRTLGLNYFVVVVNTPFKKFSEVYRDNRERGKPSFITADSILHPYLAYTNAVAATIVAKVAPVLQELLIGMYNSASSQYKSAQDASIRADAQSNCAYLAVALKLLNPSLQIAPIGESSAIAAAELANIQAGKVAVSRIFGRQCDYAVFRPLGWYLGAAQYSNFYACRQWLSRMYFTLSDPDTTGDDASTSEFRRSVLLFQSLQQAKMKSGSGFEQWQRIARALDTIGATASRERMLLPSEYAGVFAPGQRISINGLAEPFYRTKLLLSIRRQKPLAVGTASIFNSSEQRSSADTSAYFRVLPPSDDPEFDWLKARAHAYTPEGSEGPDSPLALLTLSARGCAHATNLLADSIWRLDPVMAKLLPPFQKVVRNSMQPGPYSLASARWSIFSQYFKPMAEGAQPVLKTNLWLTRRIESAFAAFVDSHLSVGPLAAQSDVAVLERANAAVSPSGAVKGDAGKFQYLDPSVDLYKRIAADTDELASVLSSQELVSDQIRGRLDEFKKFALRLAAIAERELAYRAVSQDDMRFLTNIDQVLERISAPVEGTLWLNTGEAGARGGCSLGVGRVGYLHVLCHTTHGVMLCRGPVYTYYEVPGGPIRPEHWDRKLEFGMVRPPPWTADFDVVQDTTPVRAGN